MERFLETEFDGTDSEFVTENDGVDERRLVVVGGDIEEEPREGVENEGGTVDEVVGDKDDEVSRRAFLPKDSVKLLRT